VARDSRRRRQGRARRGVWERRARGSARGAPQRRDARAGRADDGISRRRTRDGLFGVDGIVEAVRGTAGRSATATVRAIQEAVSSASEDPLPDDAAVVVLAANAAGRAA
jgi:hypothetical protein